MKEANQSTNWARSWLLSNLGQFACICFRAHHSRNQCLIDNSYKYKAQHHRVTAGCIHSVNTAELRISREDHDDVDDVVNLGLSPNCESFSVLFNVQNLNC